MLYRINHGTVKFAATTVLENINFEIRNTEKIAIVGRNGCGKTTLCKLISGEIELSKRDSDEDIYITKTGEPTIGYLKQMSFPDMTLTVGEELDKVFEATHQQKVLLERLTKSLEIDYSDKNLKAYGKALERYEQLGGYDENHNIDSLFTKFGFTLCDKLRPLSEFSGGQLTKIAFVKLLLFRPDIMILDEPTNHLDMQTVEWLEDYLKNYKKAVVIVSHDRMFLDKVCDVVYEIEHRTAKRYPGNYSNFVIKKQLDYEKQAKGYALQQKEIERLKDLVDRFKNKPSKVTMARSKLKQIEHMDKIEPPKRYDTKSFKARFQPLNQGGKDVLSLYNLAIGYDHPLGKISAQIKRGQRLAIIGDNGKGKSTLLKTLIGELPKLGGSFEYGFQIQYGYFDQQMAQYTVNQSILDNFWDEFPTLMHNDVRSALGAFLFSGEEVYKNLPILSGGEKVRLALAKMFQHGPNLLILDEPTNHMDIIGKETLESMLGSFEGTVIFVSHDRYFVNKIADSLLVFEDEGVHYYDHGYAEYRQQKNPTTKENDILRDTRKKGTDTNEAQQDVNTKQGVINPGKEYAKKKRRKEKLLTEITALEEYIKALKQQMEDPKSVSRYEKLYEINSKIEIEEAALSSAIDEWEKLEYSSF
ncbi:MAG: ABC-F family ATP-binding cassette domain-containing protein [Cellulosilyticaceae bacterium]